MRASRPPRRSAKLLGLAFDAQDGQKRLTRGPNFFLVGGSQETHEVMQRTALKLNEKLDKGGKRLENVSVEELRDMLQEACE